MLLSVSTCVFPHISFSRFYVTNQAASMISCCTSATAQICMLDQSAKHCCSMWVPKSDHRSWPHITSICRFNVHMHVNALMSLGVRAVSLAVYERYVSLICCCSPYLLVGRGSASQKTRQGPTFPKAFYVALEMRGSSAWLSAWTTFHTCRLCMSALQPGSIECVVLRSTSKGCSCNCGTVMTI